jgi:hypothetical protein
MSFEKRKEMMWTCNPTSRKETCMNSTVSGEVGWQKRITRDATPSCVITRDLRKRIWCGMTTWMLMRLCHDLCFVMSDVSTYPGFVSERLVMIPTVSILFSSTRSGTARYKEKTTVSQTLMIAKSKTTRSNESA